VATFTHSEVSGSTGPASTSSQRWARRALVETLLDGPRTGTELAEAVSLTSAGRLYHHIRALTSAKVIEQHTRGTYRIKAVPLLIMVTAADIGEALP
jgi:hypothetical protein